MSAIKALVALMASRSTSAHTYATWNPADKSTSLALSGGNLTTDSHSASDYANVRSTVSKNSGKWYWEVTVGSPQDSQAVGVCTSAFPLDNTAVGNSSVNGVTSGYLSFGIKATNGTLTGVHPTYTTGDVIGVAMDANLGITKFFKNNSLIATETHGTGTLFAMLSSYHSVNTANFGATAFVYTPPPDYNAGLYN